MQATDDYCSYTKAAEHIGERWSLLILREIGIHGSRGFNALVQGLPGISRSVLARRLRKLEDLGIIARDPSVAGSRAPYRMAPAGEQLAPTLYSLSAWAERWVPENPAVARHDPDVIVFWLTLRVDRARLPDPAAVLAFASGPPRDGQAWIVMERGTEPSVCTEDPLLPDERYIHLEGELAALYPVARGLKDWGAAFADRSVEVFGDPALVSEMPGWFLPAVAVA